MSPTHLNFDPDTFMQQEHKESLDSKYTPVPVGTYGNAFIEKVESRVQDSPDGQNAWPILDVLWEIRDPELQKATGRDKVMVRQSCFLDVTEAGALEYGPNKNIQLGQIREAVGQNKPGRAWAPAHLVGAGPATVLIEHRPDKKNPEVIYDGVKRVSAHA